MEQNRAQKETHTYMGNYCMTKEPRTYNGERKVSSINDVGKTEQPIAKNEFRSLSYTACKINSKWIKDMSVNPESITFLEENIDSKLLDISLSNIFVDLIPKTMEQKQKKGGGGTTLN